MRLIGERVAGDARMKAALTVFLKECRESLRDRRVLINSLVLGPLLGPLLFLLLVRLVVGRELEKAEQPLPVVGDRRRAGAGAGGCAAADGRRRLPPVADPELAVREQRIDLALRVAADFGANWRAGRPAQVELIYDSSRRDAQGDAARLRAMLETTGTRNGALRLLARGLSPGVATPLVVADARYRHAAGARRAAVRDAAVHFRADRVHRRHVARHRFDRRRTRAPVARTAARQSGPRDRILLGKLAGHRGF